MKNKLLHRKIIGSALGIVGIILFFIGSTLIANKYESELQSIVGNDGVMGMIAYVSITAIAIVIAPVSTLPLVPLAVSIWGWVTTGILSIIGWSIGSQVAFHLARRYGRTLIEKFVSLEKLNGFEKCLSQKDIFWSVVFLRMTVPVDVLSYALGLLSMMSSGSYFLATLIGVVPFAFIFAYTGSLPPGLQIITLIEILLFITVVYVLKNKIMKCSRSVT